MQDLIDNPVFASTYRGPVKKDAQWNSFLDARQSDIDWTSTDWSDSDVHNTSDGKFCQACENQPCLVYTPAYYKALMEAKAKQDAEKADAGGPASGLEKSCFTKGFHCFSQTL